LGTTLLSIWLKEIIPFFIRTKDIGEIHGMAVWVVMAVNYTPMYAGANSQLFFFERTKELWKRAFIAFAVNIVLNLALIPTVGIYAAAVSTFVAYMTLGYSSFFMKSYAEVKVLELKPMWWLILTLVLTVAALIIVELHWLPKAGFTVLLLIALILFGLRILRMRQDALQKKNKIQNQI
jgi:O-antigen/teichoic acid export membrane protein